MSLDAAGIGEQARADSEFYQPARPWHVRQALRQIPVEDLSGFRYVDLGSGKGRTLFVAAEFPFVEIVGVEFSRALHTQAVENIRRFRARSGGCSRITSLCMDARDFVFPDGKFVLYMFNPFGVETMQRVLDNLDRSLRLKPRHVVVVLLWPRHGQQVAKVEGMRLRRQTGRLQIFDTHAA